MAVTTEALAEGKRDRTPSIAERSTLIDRVAAASQFARSTRLRDFLLYVGRKSLKDDGAEIHEQEIGVQVFGRPESYDRSQDNIVRVNATELRKRIESYFATEGVEEPLVFSIPRGGYKPVFRWRHACAGETVLVLEEARETVMVPVLAKVISPPKTEALSPRRRTVWLWLWGAATLALIAGCGGLLWQNHELRRSADLFAQRPAVAAFWMSMVHAAPQTDIVLPDASVSMSEEVTGKPISLSDYLDRKFTGGESAGQMSADRRQALDTIFNHNLVTLGDFHAAQQILSLTPIASTLRLTPARFYEADSIKRDNVILIGGKKANPWARLFDERLNFSLEYDNAHSQAFVTNRHPLTGELARYEPVMDRNATTAYCVVAYFPNPSRTGRVMLLAGTDSDATAAAAEFLLSEEGMLSLKSRISSEQSPYFEALMKTSRLSGTSFNAELMAVRSIEDAAH
jgi:hypothetical protein